MSSSHRHDMPTGIRAGQAPRCGESGRWDTDTTGQRTHLCHQTSVSDRYSDDEVLLNSFIDVVWLGGTRGGL